MTSGTLLPLVDLSVLPAKTNSTSMENKEEDVFLGEGEKVWVTSGYSKKKQVCSLVWMGL